LGKLPGIGKAISGRVLDLGGGGGGDHVERK